MPFMKLILICYIFILMPLVSTHADSLKIGRGGDGIHVSTSNFNVRIGENEYLFRPEICASNQVGRFPYMDSDSACHSAAYVSVELLKEYASRLKLAEQKINEMESLHNSRIEKLLKDFDTLSDNFDALRKRADEK